MYHPCRIKNLICLFRVRSSAIYCIIILIKYFSRKILNIILFSHAKYLKTNAYKHVWHKLSCFRSSLKYIWCNVEIFNAHSACPYSQKKFERKMLCIFLLSLFQTWIRVREDMNEEVIRDLKRQVYWIWVIYCLLFFSAKF
jgi:hypothetical protein